MTSAHARGLHTSRWPRLLVTLAVLALAVRTQAAPLAQALRVPDGAVELAAQRSRTAKHFRLPNGRTLALISAAPLHYQDESSAPLGSDQRKPLESR